ncbi:hypothetical protein TURU_021646 [Turdus rufiventris]|nr:hypothetical protein TURU_021646 [Turdus rufiventris]
MIMTLTRHVGEEPVSIAGVMGDLQELTLLEAEVSVTGKEWQKHPIVAGPEELCILGIDFLRNGYYKDPKGFRDYHALNEVTPPLSAAMPDMLELHREITVFEKGEEIIQILAGADFAIQKSKVKGPAQEIQFLAVKWQDRRHQIPTEVINKITAMSPPTSKKEIQAFLGAIGFRRMHILEYGQIVSPLYLVTHKKNDFHWAPDQQKAFVQIKQEVAHAVALGPVRRGPEVKNVIYSAAEKKGLS